MLMIQYTSWISGITGFALIMFDSETGIGTLKGCLIMTAALVIDTIIALREKAGCSLAIHSRKTKGAEKK